MFWKRGSEREKKEQNGVPPCGQVRVLVVGDSGVGKTSLAHLITKGSSCARPPQTIGCNVGVKHTTYGTSSSSSTGIKGDAERDFFVELWDVSGHERYKDCRSLFYSQINGVIFVHDLSQRRTKTSLQSWALEIAANGTFSAPLGSGGPGGLPVPYIVIGNKADIAAKEVTRGSSGNLVDVARQWVEKQGLLSSSDELPITESFPSGGGLVAAAKEARYDKEAVMKFFRMLIRRRYFADELPAASPWSISVKNSSLSGEITSDEDQLYKSTRVVDVQIPNEEVTFINKKFPFFGKRVSKFVEDVSPVLVGGPYKYNVLPPLPAQRNLTPPPTLYPQQPMSTPETKYTSIPRFTMTSTNEYGVAARSKRADINV